MKFEIVKIRFKDIQTHVMTWKSHVKIKSCWSDLRWPHAAAYGTCLRKHRCSKQLSWKLKIVILWVLFTRIFLFLFGYSFVPIPNTFLFGSNIPFQRFFFVKIWISLRTLRKNMKVQNQFFFIFALNLIKFEIYAFFIMGNTFQKLLIVKFILIFRFLNTFAHFFKLQTQKWWILHDLSNLLQILDLRSFWYGKHFPIIFIF